MKYFIVFGLLVAVAAGSSKSQESAGADSASAAVFSGEIEDFLRTWRGIECDESAGSISYRVKANITVNEKESIKREYIIRRKPGYLYVEATDGPAKSVFARSPRYKFALKKGSVNDNEWLLFFFTDKTEEMQPDLDASVFGKFGGVFLYPLGDSIINGSNGVMGEESRESIRKFSTNPSDHNRVDFLTTKLEGAFVVNPNERNILSSFCLSCSEKSTPWHESFSRQLHSDLHRPNSSLPLCKSVVFAGKKESAGMTLLGLNAEFVDYEFEPPSDELFELRTYGLPEPLSGKPVESHRFLWFFGSAAICLLGALVFRQLRRMGVRSAPSH